MAARAVSDYSWRGTIILVSDWTGLARHCFLLVASKISILCLISWLSRPTSSPSSVVLSLSACPAGKKSVVMCLLRFAILEQSSRCLLWLWHEWTAVGDQQVPTHRADLATCVLGRIPTTSPPPQMTTEWNWARDSTTPPVISGQLGFLGVSGSREECMRISRP